MNKKGILRKQSFAWLRLALMLALIFRLSTFGVHSVVFAAVAAVFEIIPVAGPILAAVPAVSTAFLMSPLLGISTVILYIAIQQMESHIIVPVVMQKAVGLSPLIVVLALLVGGKLGGIFGILLAVPIAAVLVEFLNDWDKKKRALLPE